jgi:hypothetical protein
LSKQLFHNGKSTNSNSKVVVYCKEEEKYNFLVICLF